MSTDFDFANESCSFIYKIDFDLDLCINSLNNMTAILDVRYSMPEEEIVNCSDDIKFRRLDYGAILSDNSIFASYLTEYDIEYKNKNVLQIRKNGPHKWKITPV